VKPEKFRAVVLQAAIQGKLVPQDPNDEPAAVLLERIREEKQKLIKEGKIKKDKNDSFIFKRDNHYYENLNGKETCIDDEIPFEIPDSWAFTRLGTISRAIQYGYTTSSTEEGNARLLRITDIQDDDVDWSSVPYCIIEDEKKCRYSLHQGDIVIARTGGTIGKSFIISFEIGEDYIFASYLIRIILTDVQLSSYVNLFLKSPLYWNQISDKQQGTGQPNVNTISLGSLLIPTPPIKEQSVVLKRFDEIDRIRGYHDSLLNITSNFSTVLMKDVLNCAIQGKLTKQNPNERPVEINCKSPIIRRDNSYYEIVNGCEVCIDDSIPFQIPENWTWQRLSNICSYIHRGKSPKYSETKKYPVIAQKCNQWSGVDMSRCLFIDPESITRYDSDCIVKTGDILINSTGTGSLGRIGIYDAGLNIYELAVADSHVTIVRCYRVKSEYVYLYLISPTIQSVIEDWSTGSTNQKELPTKVIQSILVPIPPSDEQLRIQSKVKELKSLLNALE